MKLRYILSLSYLMLLFSCSQKENTDHNTASQVDKQPPNIIFLMDDQHRWDALGMINEEVITPTLDSLARSGVLFSQAVCQAPMCVPSRNSIMFGLYPNQTTVLRNSGGVKDDSLPGKTLPQYFADAGYETAGFGKTHWGKHKTNTRGFQTRYVSEIPEFGAISMAEADSAAKARYDAEIAPLGPGEENNKGYLGFTSEVPEEEHRDGWVTQQCLDYIDQRNSSKPLFLYLSYMKPHAGHNVPAGYEERYDLNNITYAQQPPWKKDHSPHSEGVNRRDMYVNYWANASEEEWKLMTMRYYANVSWIDDMMNRVLGALEDKGLLENALIVYVSDHGEMLGERFYRFNKYNLYESSVRVPFLLAGSALPNDYRGKVNEQPVELVDVMPTLLGMAGIQPERILPGKNLLEGNSRSASFASLYERPGEAAFMWRTATHKLILVFDRKQGNINEYTSADILAGEFYDLKQDPQEWNDLYGQPEIADMQQQYTQQLLEHLQRMPLSESAKVVR
jgi:arylsulfatase A-like enzyme